MLGFKLTHVSKTGLKSILAILQTVYQTYFLRIKTLNFGLNGTYYNFWWFNWQLASIDSVNGMAPNRRQAIDRANTWHYGNISVLKLAL